MARRLLEVLSETTGASSSHDRLLEAAKMLFASRGYENTTTSAIARLAHTSESQLVKHFGGKEGLLKGVFEQGWDRIARNFPNLERIPEARDRLGAVADAVISAFETDRALKYVFLFEGRRLRSKESFILAAGYLRLVAILDGLIGEMVAGGQLSREIPPEAIRSALIGTIEGLLRDHAMGERVGFRATYQAEDVKRVFRLALGAFTVDQSGKPKPEPKQPGVSFRKRA